MYGRHFKIISDHACLHWLKRVVSPNMRLARWMLTLQGFDFTIEYKPGSCHKDADALSRYPVTETYIDKPKEEVPTFVIPLRSVPELQRADPKYANVIKQLELKKPCKGAQSL